MTGRPRLLLGLVLALLMVLAQQGGYRHVVGHAADSVAMANIDSGAALAAGTQADTRERTRLCVDCLALSALGGLPGTLVLPISAPDAAQAPAVVAWLSLPRAAPTPRAQAPPQLS